MSGGCVGPRTCTVLRFHRRLEMTLYSYIVAQDGGFAPNPFFGYCTLACCKPGIRKHATPGDWIVGLSPKSDGYRVVYYMKVDDVIPFHQYWKRFRRKRPNVNGNLKQKNGDNIYEPKVGGFLGYRQLPSAHSKSKFKSGEDREKMMRDLNGDHVLISRHFAYFGSEPRDLSSRIMERLRVGRGYRHLPEDIVEAFQKEVRRQGWTFGVHAKPRKWNEDDQSWKGSTCGGK